MPPCGRSPGTRLSSWLVNTMVVAEGQELRVEGLGNGIEERLALAERLQGGIAAGPNGGRASHAAEEGQARALRIVQEDVPGRAGLVRDQVERLTDEGDKSAVA